MLNLTLKNGKILDFAKSIPVNLYTMLFLIISRTDLLSFRFRVAGTFEMVQALEQVVSVEGFISAISDLQ